MPKRPAHAGGNLLVFILLIPLALLVGCSASVPPEAVDLSKAVGERISATQASHEAFVTEYFAASRARIEDFIRWRWTPEFLETFVRDSKVADMLIQPHPFDEDDLARLQEEFSASGVARPQDAIAAAERALGDRARGETILQFAEAAWDQIDAKRRELVDPLNGMEAEALKQLRANYSELSAMNGTITGHLQSVVEVHEMQNDVLHRLDLLDERDAALERVTSTNRAVERVLSGAQKADEIVGKLKSLLGKNDGTSVVNGGE